MKLVQTKTLVILTLNRTIKNKTFIVYKAGKATYKQKS